MSPEQLFQQFQNIISVKDYQSKLDQMEAQLQ